MQVKNWITINEPWIITYLGYGTPGMAPGLNSPAELPYISAHNLLLAHAKVWHMYNDEFRASQGGMSFKPHYCGPHQFI